MVKRVDANHVMIVKALRDVGASVQSLADIGKGCPDLLVARGDRLWLMEVKDGSLPPSRRRLTEDEANWHAMWRSKVYIVESVEDALKAVGAME